MFFFISVTDPDPDLLIYKSQIRILNTVRGLEVLTVLLVVRVHKKC
jgi:hypothetical protein